MPGYFTNGKELEHSIVFLLSRANVALYSRYVESLINKKNTYYLDQVKELSPSVYAVSHHIRDQTIVTDSRESIDGNEWLNRLYLKDKRNNHYVFTHEVIFVERSQVGKYGLSVASRDTYTTNRMKVIAPKNIILACSDTHKAPNIYHYRLERNLRWDT